VRSPLPKPSSEFVQPVWSVQAVVDGDTVDVTNGGADDRVRLLGIDTPERGDCGFGPAADLLSSLVDRKVITLTPAGAGNDDRDRYGRLLRYVDVDGVDAGLALLDQGLAIARYDSRDGYGAHPREDAYIAADAGVPASGCSAVEPANEPLSVPAQEPAVVADVSYTNCAAARDAGAAPVHRGEPGYGSHLDRDDDGIGCE